MNILVVEDLDLTRQQLVDLLLSEGDNNILTAPSASEAFELLGIEVDPSSEEFS